MYATKFVVSWRMMKVACYIPRTIRSLNYVLLHLLSMHATKQNIICLKFLNYSRPSSCLFFDSDSCIALFKNGFFILEIFLGLQEYLQTSKAETVKFINLKNFWCTTQMSDVQDIEVALFNIICILCTADYNSWKKFSETCFLKRIFAWDSQFLQISHTFWNQLLKMESNNYFSQIFV